VYIENLSIDCRDRCGREDELLVVVEGEAKDGGCDCCGWDGDNNG